MAVHIKDHELQQQLILLSQTLYGENKNNLFKGEDLWRSLSNYLSIKVCKKSKNCDLPPINPN